MEWEEKWRREKERRKEVMEERGEEFERESRRLTWIRAYNDSRMGMKAKENENDRRLLETINEWQEIQATQKYSKDTYPSEIFQAMEELRSCSVLTDLTLSVEHGRTIHAHSIVLAAVSSLIHQVLQQRSEKNEREIFLQVGPEVSHSGICTVLEFAYTGSITGLKSKSLAQIQAAALYLEVPRLLELCTEEQKRVRKKDADENIRKTVGEEHRKVNLQSIRRLWEDRVGCDVELEAEGRIFHGKDVTYYGTSKSFRYIHFVSALTPSASVRCRL